MTVGDAEDDAAPVEPRPQIAQACARMIVSAYPPDYRPGFVAVVVVNESSELGAMLEIDASIAMGAAITELGSRVLLEYAKRLRTAIGETSRKMAADLGCEYQQLENNEGLGSIRREDMS